MSPGLTYPEALVIGALQGVTELFPVSSLGHSVILPALVGGRWARDLNVSAPESPYLAFVVGLHVATALALLAFFWRDWVRIARGIVSSVRHRRVTGPDERLAWMVILATIPVGLAGLLLEHAFRTVLGRPVPAAVFLLINGLVLVAAERLRRRAATTWRSDHGTAARQTEPRAAMTRQTEPRTAESGRTEADLRAEPVGARAGEPVPVTVGPGGRGTVFASAAAAGPGGTQAAVDLASDRRLAAGTVGNAVLIGSAQILALLPGISRSGVTMAAGLLRGLTHEDAARFAFLLATPVILAAGVLKLPDLFGDLGAGIRGQVLAGSVAAGLSAYAAVKFLTRYFETRTLTPFAVYCLLAGIGSLAWLTLG